MPRMLMTARRLVFGFLPLLLLVGLVGCKQWPAEPQPEATASLPANTTAIFLVRHAEKEAAPRRDPELTKAGRARAKALAQALQDVALDAVHSTNYIRTRATAAPTAGAQGVETTLYDPRDLPAFAKLLLRTPGNHLVVGHSNTTPKLVELLGGDPGPAIREADEFDRLYIVLVSPHETRSFMLRYGP